MLQENTDLLLQIWGEVIIVTDTGIKSLFVSQEMMRCFFVV